MMFAMPTEDYHVDPVIVDALNKLLILHADHEQNCSTSTVRIVGSAKTYIPQYLLEFVRFGVLLSVQIKSN